MHTPEVIAESFRQLDFHDDTLLDIRVMPARSPEKGDSSFVEIQLYTSPADRRVIRFSDCANLRVAMDFDVLAQNHPPNTSRVDADTEVGRIRSLIRSQEDDWDVEYRGTARSPIANKLAALDELVFFRVQFFGGAVDVVARTYQVEVTTVDEKVVG